MYPVLTVLVVKSVLGNIFRDGRLARKYQRLKVANMCESLDLSRSEMERPRLKRRTDKGTDMGILLEPGSKIENGDVLWDRKDRIIVANQRAEKVLSFSIREPKRERVIELSALIGHAIGNRHRPIAISDDGKISFPVMAESEVQTFSKLIPDGRIESRIEERIFRPSTMIAVDQHHGH